mmetsp:Transcript_5839/g.7447  ORF Transcript_5839/g.7447 Transcript_5839/m.7447 type:complete len:113 (-) Transcript_5839:477-815(-)
MEDTAAFKLAAANGTLFLTEIAYQSPIRALMILRIPNEIAPLAKETIPMAKDTIADVYREHVIKDLAILVSTMNDTKMRSTDVQIAMSVGVITNSSSRLYSSLAEDFLYEAS